MDPNEIKLFVDSFKQKFSIMPWYMKIVCYVLIPVGILLVLHEEGRKFILSFLENRSRNKADTAAATASQAEVNAKNAIVKEEGSLEQLDKDQKDAQDKASKSTTDEDVDFFNNRGKK
jgi:hypothetical protein